MPRLNEDVDMIERMEVDLASKAQTAYAAAGISASIHGVYSLDDLEAKLEEELCGRIALGVGYLGAQPTYLNSGRHENVNVDQGAAAKSISYVFAMILAVPFDTNCTQRYDATKLLTILRRGILGSIVSGDRTTRTWSFVREFPNTEESTKTMAYYSQMWEVKVIETGSTNT